MVADEVSLFETLERMKADLAVVDLSLTRRNGLELIRRLRREFPQVKLIAISVHDEPSVELGALRAGADAFVPKGLISAHLIEAIDAALKKLPTDLSS